MSTGIADDQGCSFGTAVTLARSGRRIQRKGWGDVWVRRVDLYSDREFMIREEPCAVGTWVPFLVRRTADNTLEPWMPSQGDLFATDWFEVEDSAP